MSAGRAVLDVEDTDLTVEYANGGPAQVSERDRNLSTGATAKVMDAASPGGGFRIPKTKGKPLLAREALLLQPRQPRCADSP